MFGRSLNKYTRDEKKSQFRFFLELTKKNTKSPSCPQVKQFFSETSVLMCSRVIFGKRWPFLVTKSSTFEGSKKASLFSHNGIFRVYHIYNGTCPQKKLKRQLIVAFEKQTLKWQWKEDKIICGKANSYFRRLSDPSKNEEISKVVYFFSFGLKLKMKLVETVSVTIGVKFRQTSYGSKTN